MTLEEAKEKLANFASRDKERRSICHIATKGTCVYATDGRIAFRTEVGKVPDDCDGFPIPAIDEFADTVKHSTGWMELDWAQFDNLCKGFVKALSDYIKEQESDIRERYIRTDCPTCGGEVYWDRDMQKLVWIDEIEGADHSPGHVDYPVKLILQKESGVHLWLPINFGYLYLVRKAFGQDVVFSCEVVKSSDIARLLMKTKDGKSHGVMMPLRIDGAYTDSFTDRVLETRSWDGAEG